MHYLTKKILGEKLKSDLVALFWLGGTSYIIKDKNYTIGLDIYLSNACMNEDGSFKRLIPQPIEPEEITLDYLIATHDHGDHFDTDSLNKFIKDSTPTKLIGPTSVIKAAKNMGIHHNRLIKLDRGEMLEFKDLNFKGVFADHGEYSPDCIGIIINIGIKTIYFTSDTCYRPDLPELVKLEEKIDLLIVPINGTGGNPDPKDASYITFWVKPEKVIPTHFWMFSEHGGDPGLFMDLCKKIVPKSKIIIPAIGEKITI